MLDLKEREWRDKEYKKALNSFPYKLFELDKNSDRFEANKLLNNRLDNLEVVELSELLLFVVSEFNGDFYQKFTSHFSYKLIEKDEIILFDRLQTFTVLESVSFIAQINGRIGSGAVNKGL